MLRAARWDEAKAREFADRAHRSIGQLEPYTGQPYIVHPAAVVDVVRSVPHTPAMIAASWLHDTVEDVPGITVALIEQEFDAEVAGLVDQLTNVAGREVGNRAKRIAANRAHSAQATPAAKTVKLADLIVGVSTIVQRAPRFARTYLPEKVLLVEVLQEGDSALWARAVALLAEQQAALERLLRGG